MAQTVAIPTRESEGPEEMLRALRRILPERMNAGDVFGAVMCSFTRRLTRGEARHLLLELSPALRLYFQDCVLNREEAAASFDREAFLKQLAFKLNLPLDETERVVFGVFAFVQSRISQRAARHVASQLPQDLELMWREAGGSGGPAARFH
jgi:uncharacterized protein (DUF2267 family)